jgi:hypothetical protein
MCFKRAPGSKFGRSAWFSPASRAGGPAKIRRPTIRRFRFTRCRMGDGGTAFRRRPPTSMTGYRRHPRPLRAGNRGNQLSGRRPRAICDGLSRDGRTRGIGERRRRVGAAPLPQGLSLVGRTVLPKGPGYCSRLYLKRHEPVFTEHGGNRARDARACATIQCGGG